MGGVSPILFAIILVYITQDREGRRDYWQRVIDFRRIGKKWHVVILLTVPLLTALAALLDTLLGGSGIRLEAATRFLVQPLGILPFAIFTFFFGPFPEELGWRGYALDRMQIKWSALGSSLILGVVWALWHLPLFFIEGTYQNNLGVGTPFFWVFMLEVIPKTIVITWIYNHNRRSTLSAVLLHFMDNFVGELFELSERAELYQFALWIAMAIVVTIVWGPRTLTRNNEG
jgi:membrane protease YdiL (CAAX protease family)